MRAQASSLLLALVSMPACAGDAGGPEPADVFLAVSVSGAGMNRACQGGCEWELAADAAGHFAASDEAGTESFELSAAESDKLMAVVTDARFIQALGAREQCAGVIDSAMAISTLWERAGALTDPQAAGCATNREHPYFPVVEAMLELHAAHFPCDDVMSDTGIRALCFLAPW